MRLVFQDVTPEMLVPQKDGNLIKLRLRTFDQTPHTKAGVTSTIVLPSDEPKYRFATAGNDVRSRTLIDRALALTFGLQRFIRIWNVNHASDSPAPGVQIHILDTQHTNTINAMAFPGNGRLWSVGADKRVSAKVAVCAWYPLMLRLFRFAI